MLFFLAGGSVHDDREVRACHYYPMLGPMKSRLRWMPSVPGSSVLGCRRWMLERDPGLFVELVSQRKRGAPGEGADKEE
jgi:hypothetical protein